MIHNLFIDVGDVLLDIDPRRTIAGLTAIFKTNSDGTPLFAPKDLFGVGDQPLLVDYQDGTIGSQQFFDEILRHCVADTPREKAVAAWNAMLLEIPPQRVEALRRLHNKGIHIFLLSNINEEHHRQVLAHLAKADLRIGRDIDDAYFSHLMRCSKPSPQIYEKALRLSGAVANETLYIDDMKENIDAGARFGLRTLHAKGDAWLDKVEKIIEGVE